MNDNEVQLIKRDVLSLSGVKRGMTLVGINQVILHLCLENAGDPSALAELVCYHAVQLP